MNTELSWFYYYDETSPTFLRYNYTKTHGVFGKIKPIVHGNVAGWVDESSGYAKVNHLGRKISAHTIIYSLFYGEVNSGLVIDHFDGSTRNNKIENLQIKTQSQNMRNRKKHTNNKSGVTGVWLDMRKGLGSWLATWKELSGKNGKKSFPILKYGNDLAFELACLYRKSTIERLVVEGAEYTESHGVRQ